MTSSGASGPEREVERLRERVAGLEQQLAQFIAGGELRDAHGAVSISEREALFVEAERISHMGSWVWSIETDEVTWSEELFRILGFDPERDVASVEAFVDAVHPDDRDRVRSSSVITVVTGMAPRVEHRILRPDGAVRHVLSDGTVLFDKDAKLRRIVGTVLDVTEAREAQRKLARAKVLLEEAQALGHMGSFAFDLEHGTFEWSREFCHILGVPSDTSGSSELLFAHVHFEDVARLTELYQEVLEHGGRVEADVRIIQPTGEVRHVRLACVGQPGTDGSMLALHGTMLDLTEQHRLQERLMHAQKMEAIGRLAGGIAHDFNNLLMVVRGNLELLGGGERAELRAIMSAVESAQTLTAGLLAFGRKAHLERRVLDLNALVTQTVGLLQRLIGEHITLSAVLDESCLRSRSTRRTCSRR
jgi:two-component system cell cycle sensor histidine kinase/response regulator CckA